MTYFKQNILAAGLLVLSLSASIALGHVLSQSGQSKSKDLKIVKPINKLKTHQFTHSIKILIPKLG